MTEGSISKSRMAVHQAVVDAFANPPNEFSVWRAVLGDDQFNRIESELAAEFESKGRRLYRDTDGIDFPDFRESMWGGEFAQQLSALLAVAASSQLHVGIIAIAPVVCPSYCAFKRRFSEADEINVAITVADALLMARFNTPVPIGTISYYIVRRRMLDPMCGC